MTKLNEKGIKRGFHSPLPKAWTKTQVVKGPFETLAAWEPFESQWYLVPESRCCYRKSKLPGSQWKHCLTEETPSMPDWIRQADHMFCKGEKTVEILKLQHQNDKTQHKKNLRLNMCCLHKEKQASEEKC